MSSQSSSSSRNSKSYWNSSSTMMRCTLSNMSNSLATPRSDRSISSREYKVWQSTSWLGWERYVRQRHCHSIVTRLWCSEFTIRVKIGVGVRTPGVSNIVGCPSTIYGDAANKRRSVPRHAVHSARVPTNRVRLWTDVLSGTVGWIVDDEKWAPFWVVMSVQSTRRRGIVCSLVNVPVVLQVSSCPVK